MTFTLLHPFKVFFAKGLSRTLLMTGCLALTACTSPSMTSAPTNSNNHMIAAANPLAAEAGLAMLRKGGSAIDATIAAQMVLTLVEPQSSGIGGGAFLLHYDAKGSFVETYDGRETAPLSASADMFLKSDGSRKKFYEAVVGGSAVGVPGLIRMLEAAHQKHGTLPWKDLFQPAIEMAREGFLISPRLAKLIARDKYLKTFPETRAYFYQADGTAKPVGTRLQNQELAATLARVAENGSDGFYAGPVADGIIKTVQTASQNPSGMTQQDMAGYQAKRRPPVCLPYRTWMICGMGPPSSGGLTTLQIMGMLERFDLGALEPFGAKAVHLVAEASKLAFADRNTYMADSDFVAVPSQGLLDRAYLASRAALISPFKASDKRKAGSPSKPSHLARMKQVFQRRT